MTGWYAPFGIQLVSVTNQFRFEAPDGKQRGSDALDVPYGAREKVPVILFQSAKMTL